MQKPPPISDLLSELASFAQRLQERLIQPQTDWHNPPTDDEWCLTCVMCHLRDVEREVHQMRFKALLEAENAFIAGAVADEWVVERRYREQDGLVAVAEFVQARVETVQLLTGLDETMWQRQGQHAFFGPTSMHELLNLVVQHDQAHWVQVGELLSL